MVEDLDARESLRLTNLLGGALVTQILSCSAALGVPDALAGGPASSARVAQRCGAGVDATGRLLRALVSLGVLAEASPDRFCLTDMGHLLRSDHPRSLRSFAVVQGALMAPLWAGLGAALTGGKPAGALDGSFYEHLAAHPDLDEHWNRAMAETATAWLGDEVVFGGLDWDEHRRVVDVGGGHGALLGVLLQRHAHLRGVLYDSAHVVEGAPGLLVAMGVAERVEVVAGDFFESVPTGGDVYLLARVVFNWDDGAALALLRACRAAMGGRDAVVLVIDQVVPADDSPHPAKVNDMSLLAMGGRARRLGEWEALAEGAGLCLVGPPRSLSALDAWASLVLRVR